MAIFKDDLEELLTYYKLFINIYSNQIKKGPDGKLIHQINHGHNEFLQVLNKDNKKIRRGVTNNVVLLRQLAQKEFAVKALKVLEPDVDLLQHTIEKIKPFDPDDILKSMTKAYKLLPEDYFFDRGSTTIDLNLPGAIRERIERHREWGNSPYTLSDYLPEYRDKRTSKGELVRSKSELLIIEQLYHYGIPTHYEEERTIDGVTIDPDFTFEDADGRPFYWEHLGMMRVSNYAQKNFNKLGRYYGLGIIPGINLILTFDGDGTINMGMIDAVINNEVIPRL